MQHYADLVRVIGKACDMQMLLHSWEQRIDEKMKSITLFIIILLLLLVAGCTAAQSDDTTGRVDNDNDETKIQTMIGGLLSDELTDEEFIKLIDELAEEEAEQLLDELYNILGAEGLASLLDRLFPLTEEQIEAQRIRMEERRRTNVDYIIRGNFTPAADDIDLRTIERFVFAEGSFFGGSGFVLDRMYGRVYYEPSGGSMGLTIVWLDEVQFSATYAEEDLDRLIQAIEESNLRDWEEVHSGGADEHPLPEDGGVSWQVGILFSDGTMLRRSGYGTFWRDVASLPDQFAILTDFIKTIGAEIELRHEAESDSEN